MDIEKLIERLRNNNIENNCHDCALGYYAFEAAATLSTLQAENARLREELEYEREHANAYHEECGQWEAENEKLRAELEQVKQELDEAVEYLRGQCRYCKRNLVCTSRKGPHSNCWEWRGQKKD